MTAHTVEVTELHCDRCSHRAEFRKIREHQTRSGWLELDDLTNELSPSWHAPHGGDRSPKARQGQATPTPASDPSS